MNHLEDRFARLMRRARGGGAMNPARDWLVLLSSFVVLFAAIVLVNLFLFGRAAEQEVSDGSGSALPAVFSTSTLSSIQALFSARAAEEARFESGSTTFADPSQ